MKNITNTTTLQGNYKFYMSGMAFVGHFLEVVESGTGVCVVFLTVIKFC